MLIPIVFFYCTPNEISLHASYLIKKMTLVYLVLQLNSAGCISSQTRLQLIRKSISLNPVNTSYRVPFGDISNVLQTNTLNTQSKRTPRSKFFLMSYYHFVHSKLLITFSVISIFQPHIFPIICIMRRKTTPQLTKTIHVLFALSLLLIQPFILINQFSVLGPLFLLFQETSILAPKISY